MSKLDELTTKVEEMRNEIVRLSEIEDITPEDDTRLSELTDEFPTRQAELETERERQKVIDTVRSLKSIIPGTPQSDDVPDPLGQPDSIRDDNKVWDLNEVRSAMSMEPERGLNALSGRAVAAVDKAAGLNARQKEQITRFVDALSASADFDEDDAIGARKVLAHIVTTSSPEYQRAWSRALKSAIRTGMPDPTAVSTLSRAMSLTDAAGGYAVPLPVDPTLVMNHDVDVNPFRQISTQRTIVTDQLRTVNSTGATFSWDGEAAEASDDATTFANIDISVHKAQGTIPFSIEVSQDYPGFTDDVRMLVARGRDNLEASAFATGLGNGSNQPVGIVTALTGGSFEVSTATTDTFAVGDLFTVEETLPAERRPRASWVANKAIYNDVRQFGSADGFALWERLGAGQPNELLGYPTYESSVMDGSVTALAENYIMVFGDFSDYYIVDRVGLSMELVPHLLDTGNNRPNGQRAFYCYWRVGADSVNDRSFILLNAT